MNSCPQFSILMTAYNRENYIAEAIDSVLAQTLKDFELIIVDDCSRDNTYDIAISYQYDKRVKVHKNKVNMGDYPNRNIAASLATGEILIYVDSDDKINPDALDYLSISFKSTHTINYACIYKYDDFISPTYLDPIESIRYNYFNKQILNIGPGGSAFRANFFRQMGGFPLKYGPANDMYFNLLCANQTGVLLLPYDYLFYRIHDNQEANNKYAYIHNGYSYFNDFMKNDIPGLTKTEKKILINKNKRRFLLHAINYLTFKKDFSGFFRLFKLTQFGFYDVLKGIFN